MIKPSLHVYQTVTQPIPHQTPTAIAFNNRFIDNANGFNPAINNTRYYPQHPGWYDCFGQAVLFTDPRQVTFDMAGAFRVNDGQADSSPYGSATSLKGIWVAFTVQVKATVFCNGTTDFINFWVTQSSSNGSAIQTYYLAGNTNSFMKISWAGLN